jgi:CRP-like cAMP-binding protein
MFMDDSSRSTALVTVRFDETMLERLALVGFLAGYSGPTRDSYRTDLRLFTTWLAERQVRLLDVQRTHIELDGRWLEERPRCRRARSDPGWGLEEIERLLAEVAILRMLSADDVHALALDARPLFLGPGQRFVVEGREGTSLFLVGEGEVEVRLRKSDGTDWLVETMGRGEVVGEMALLTGERRAATVRSVDESLVFEISREQYEPLLLDHPEWLEELAAIMQKRLLRRQARLAAPDGGSPQTLLARTTVELLTGTSPPASGLPNDEASANGTYERVRP